MAEQFKSQNNGGIKNHVSKILEELCVQNESESIEADIVALFEDIAKLFAGREDEFLNFEKLSADAKRAIYTEIKNIIALLQQLKGAENKEAVMEMLCENLIVNCSKHSEKFKSLAEKLDKREQMNLKRRFADAILLALYRQRQLYALQNKAVPKKLSDEIEKYVGQIQKAKAVAVNKRSHVKGVAQKKAIAAGIKLNRT